MVSFIGYGAMFAYVYGPVCILILVDIIFFVLTSVLLRRAGIGAGNRHAREKYRFVFVSFSPTRNLMLITTSLHIVQQFACHFRSVCSENRLLAGRVYRLHNRLSKRGSVRHRRHRNAIQRLDFCHFRL